jgi:hypothetical protein
MTHDTTDLAAVCERCDWLVPEPLWNLARRVEHPRHSAWRFLMLAHCCVCVQVRCACGGTATIEALTALIEELGDAPTPPGPAEWWDAVQVYSWRNCYPACRPTVLVDAL